MQEVSDLSVIGWLQRNFDCVKDVNGESSPLWGEEHKAGCCTPVMRLAVTQDTQRCRSHSCGTYLRKDTLGNRVFSLRYGAIVVCATLKTSAMRTDMWQKLVHAFTRGIDSTLRCLRTILSRTLNSAYYNKHECTEEKL